MVSKLNENRDKLPCVTPNPGGPHGVNRTDLGTDPQVEIGMHNVDYACQKALAFHDRLKNEPPSCKNTHGFLAQMLHCVYSDIAMQPLQQKERRPTPDP
jgi:hypothetical protein